MKKHWEIWVGFCIILIAVLIVLSVIFLPRMAAKSDMKELLELAAAPGAQYVMLIDPSYQHPGILTGQGREIALTGDTLSQVQSALAALAKDFSCGKKEPAGTGAFGMHLLVKTAEGEIVKIYFAKDAFYAELKGNAYYFTVDDAQHYATCYDVLLAAFS